ncbi:hypothetical protein KKA33_00250 [Patescibacteria group bacterium]|nr:hypothetical protein [Patescibacteria group bacterium]
MSKRKHKNRPRKQPSKQPQQIFVKPEEAIAGHTRRNILIGFGGAVATGGVLGLIKFLGGEKVTQKQVPRNVPQKRPVTPKLPEYDEWASKIELPQFHLEEQLNWSMDKRLDYFLPQNVGLEKVKKLLDQFDDLKEKTFRSLDNAKNLPERNATIEHFFSELVSLYLTATGEAEKTSDSAYEDLNRFLLVGNQFLFGTKFYGLYSVKEVLNVIIQHNNKKTQIPIIFARKQHDLLPVILDAPDNLDSSIAAHDKKANCIYIDEIRLARSIKSDLELLENSYRRLGKKMRQIDKQALFRGVLNAVIAHESMHAILHSMGIDSMGNDAIKRKGNIRLIGATLRQFEYEHYNNINLHELAAMGYGLFSSGESAILNILNTTDPPGRSSRYEMAFNIAMAGIVHSRTIDHDTHQELLTGKVSSNTLISAISQMSDEELHRIGKLMAKLAIYLTQE